MHSHVDTLPRVQIGRSGRRLRTLLASGIGCMLLTAMPAFAQTTTTIRWATGAFGNQPVNPPGGLAQGIAKPTRSCLAIAASPLSAVQSCAASVRITEARR
jgi:hypothetical protein